MSYYSVNFDHTKFLTVIVTNTNANIQHRPRKCLRIGMCAITDCFCLISYNSYKFGRSLNAPLSICWTPLCCNRLRSIRYENNSGKITFELVQFSQIQLRYQNTILTLQQHLWLLVCLSVSMGGSSHLKRRSHFFLVEKPSCVCHRK